MTPELLLMQILSQNDDCIFWATCLVMFFGLLQKSNLFGTDASGFNGDKHLTRDCFSVSEDRTTATVSVKWAKNNQTKQTITLFSLPNHPLCPITALLLSFRTTKSAPPLSPAFTITSASFNHKLRTVTEPYVSGISSHSFRRGGATWALSCGIPGEIVKAMGDWQSPCYLLYLDQIPTLLLIALDVSLAHISLRYPEQGKSHPLT